MTTYIQNRNFLVGCLGFILLMYAPLGNTAGDGDEETGFAESTSQYIRDYLSDPRRVGTLAGSILGSALTAHPAGSVVGSLVGFLVGKHSMFDEDKVRAEREAVVASTRNIVPAQSVDAVRTLSFSHFQSDSGSGKSSGEPVSATEAPVLAQSLTTERSLLQGKTNDRMDDLVSDQRSIPRTENREAPPAELINEVRVAKKYKESPDLHGNKIGSVNSLDRPVNLESPPVSTAATSLNIAAICNGGLRAVDRRVQALCYYNQSN